MDIFQGILKASNNKIELKEAAALAG